MVPPCTLVNSTHRILMTVFQLSGDLFIKEPQLGPNNGGGEGEGKIIIIIKKKNYHGEEDNSKGGRQGRMSSLNITTKMKKPPYCASWPQAKLFCCRLALLLKLRRSRPLAYKEGKHRKPRMAHCCVSLLREYHYEGQYIF